MTLAIYRQVHTTIWQDNWIAGLEPTDKLLWFYLLTNPKTTQSGVYEFSERYASFETGLSRKEVAGALQHFIEAGRVLYDQATSELMIVNWLKYNSARSPKVAAVVDKELESIKCRDFAIKVIKLAQQYEYPIRVKADDLDSVSVPYQYSTDTILQPEPEPEPTHNQNQQQNQQAACEDAGEAAAAVDPKESLTFFQENLGVMPPIVQQQVEDWASDFGNEIVIEAIKRAVESGKEWRYAQGILRQWDKKGLKTMAQIEADDVSHSRQGAAHQSNYGKPMRSEAKPDWLDKPYQPSEQSEDPALHEEIAAKLKHLQELRKKDEKGSKNDADTKTT